MRGFEVEDSAAVLIGFASGALGTITVSDTAVSPWSWELTAGENPAYPRQDAFCYLVAGTRGALSLPSLDLYDQDGERSWMRPLQRSRLAYEPADPLARQIANFRGVIRGSESPVVPGREGLKTLEVVDAVKRAAASGERIALAH